MHALIADRDYAELDAQLPADTPDTPAQENERSLSGCFIQAMVWDAGKKVVFLNEQ